MRIDIITLFPQMFSGPFSESIIKRAQEEKKVTINIHDLRQWAIDEHGTVDDRPYGGGTGMVLRPEPIAAALDQLKLKVKHSTLNQSETHLSVAGNRAHAKTDSFFAAKPQPKTQNHPPKKDNKTIKQGSSVTILLSAAGKLYNQQKAEKLARVSHLILICGHYEGVDQRIADYFVDEELSIGDYVLTGGEIPAMVVVDSVVRLIPGVLEKQALQEESFSLQINSGSEILATAESQGKQQKKIQKLLEYPHYTRPANFRGYQVPQVLLSGNHAEIAKWRLKQALKRTRQNRPDLLK